MSGKRCASVMARVVKKLCENSVGEQAGRRRVCQAGFGCWFGGGEEFRRCSAITPEFVEFSSAASRALMGEEDAKLLATVGNCGNDGEQPCEVAPCCVNLG